MQLQLASSANMCGLETCRPIRAREKVSFRRARLNIAGEDQPLNQTPHKFHPHSFHKKLQTNP